MRAITDLFRSVDHDRLAADLGPWLVVQRWFGGKARQVTGVAVVDTVVLDPLVLDVLAVVTFADGHVEHYQIPLCAAPEGIDERWRVGEDLADATAVPPAAQAIAEATLRVDKTRSAAGGRLVGTGSNTLDLGEARRSTAEQSNTSIVFGDRHILKVFRRLEAGINPDVEVTAALTDAGFDHVPAQHGALLLEGDGRQETALAVLTDFVTGSREGWDLAVADVQAVVGGGQQTPLLAALEDLGRATGEAHVALREAFGAQEADPAHRREWAAAMTRQAEQVLQTAADRAPDGAASVLARRDELLRRLAAIADGELRSPLIRIHGDYHLGQVLRSPDSRWNLIDFEGEPVRPLAERRRPNAPLRDVAGMLRSFDYAAAQGASAGAGELPTAAVRWRDAARRRFLDGYQAVTAPAGILPSDDRWRRHLAIFELDKAVYELGYELANRPTWVPIPVGGILRVLDAP